MSYTPPATAISTPENPSTHEDELKELIARAKRNTSTTALQATVRAALTHELPQIFDLRHGELEVRARYQTPHHAWTNKETGEKVMCSFVSGLYDGNQTSKLIDAIVRKNIIEQCDIYYLPHTMSIQSERYKKYRHHNQWTYFHHCGKWDIGKIQALTFDIDPVKALLPGDDTYHYPSASDEERQHVLDVSTEFVALWTAEGFPIPHVISTGNGVQIVIKVPPHTVYAKKPTQKGDAYDTDTMDILRLFEHVFTIIRHHFRERPVDFDRASLGLAQGCRMPGCVNWKGEDTPERPRRIAATLHLPERAPYVHAGNPDFPGMGNVLPAEWTQLEAFVGKYAEVIKAQDAATRPTYTPPTWRGTQGEWKPGDHGSYERNTQLVQTLLEKNTIEARITRVHEGDLYVLQHDACFFSRDRQQRDHDGGHNPASILVEISGKLNASCRNTDCQEHIQHNGGVGWYLLRKLGDEGYKKRMEAKEAEQRQEALQAKLRQGAAIREIEGTILDPEDVFLQDKAYWHQLNTLVKNKDIEGILDPSFIRLLERLSREELTLVRRKLYTVLLTSDQKHALVSAIVDIRRQKKTQEVAEEPLDDTAIIHASFDRAHIPFDPLLTKALTGNLLRSNMLIEKRKTTSQIFAETAANAVYQQIEKLRSIEEISPKSIDELKDLFTQMIRPPKEYPMTLLVRYPFSDLGNAFRCADVYKDLVKYNTRDNEWYYYREGVWKADPHAKEVKSRFTSRLTDPNPDLALFQSLPVEDRQLIDPIELGKWVKTVQQHAENNEDTKYINSALEMASLIQDFWVEPDAFNKNRMLLNVKNGTIELEFGFLRPHNPQDYMTKQVPIVYDPDATCPHWLEILDYITYGNQEYIDYFQRVFGYCLTGDISEKCFFILHGEKDTLKSTVILVLASILGEYADVMEQKTILERDTDALSNEVLAMKGMRVKYTSEASASQHLAAPLIKMLTGGTEAPIRARGLYKEAESFVPTTKLFLDTNQIPYFESGDDALTGRMKVVPFTHEVLEHEKNRKYFITYLAPELPGILAWAVRGCRIWYENQKENGEGLRHIQLVQDASLAIKDEKDTLKPFIDEALIEETNPGVFTSSGDLYDAYKRWCQRRLSQQKFAMTSQRFYRDFATRGFIKGDTTQAKGYKFVRVRNEWRESYRDISSPTRVSLEAMRDNLS